MHINFIIGMCVVHITVHDYLDCKVVITDHANNRSVGYKGTVTGCSNFASRKLGTYIGIY